MRESIGIRVSFIFWSSICLSVASLLTMESIESSRLFPQMIISAETRYLLDLHINRQWGGQKKEQLRLLRHLETSCFAENIMPDYRLTANDYQQAAKDPVVLQSWIAYLPADMRDIHGKRFFNEMCFTNKLNIIKQLEVLGLRIDRLEPELIVRLEKRARAKGYQELAGYLLAFSRSSRSISNPTKCSEVKP